MATDNALCQFLKKYNLAEYGGKLTEMGYGDEPDRLCRLNHQQLDDLYTRLGMLSSHKYKFTTMIESIQLVCDAVPSRPRAGSGEQVNQTQLMANRK
jgi:hypothetical protein